MVAKSKESPKEVRTSPTKGTVKELEIVNSEAPSLLKIRFKSGGEVPVALQGYWNNRGQAQQQIDLYMNQRTPKPAEVLDSASK